MNRAGAFGIVGEEGGRAEACVRRILAVASSAMGLTP